MRFLANLIYLKAAVLYLPVLCYQMLVQGKNRRGWRQRFGYWPVRPGVRPRIWVHAVSLGEVNATPLLVERLQRSLPRYDILVSTTTDTGYARACRLYGPERVFRFPLDFSWVVNRVLRRVQPAMIVLVELEVWYNLVRTATRRGIPVAVVNGRLTKRSARRFTWLGRLVRPMFRDLAWVGAQDQPIADRLVRLGAAPDRVEVTGSVKWDTATVGDTIEGADALAVALGITPNASLWVCGSTGPGEESIILDAYARLLDSGASPTLVIVPRKPERFDEVAALIRSRGYTCLRRSEHRDDDGPYPEAHNGDQPQPIILGDTMGDLRKFYSLAQAVFVGRSLVPLGGSDPMEAAALAKSIIVGPHTDNFAGPVAAFAAADAIRMADNAQTLAAVVTELIDQPESGLGDRARQVVINNQGATDRTVRRLLGLLNSGRPANRDPESQPDGE